MDKQIIRQIVARCHVSESNHKVIRYVISRLRNKYVGFRSMCKSDRRKFMRLVIAAHKDNKGTYRRVMMGL